MMHYVNYIYIYINIYIYKEEENECNNEFGVNSKIALEKRLAYLEN